MVPGSPSDSLIPDSQLTVESTHNDLQTVTQRVNVLAEGFHKLINGPNGFTNITAVLTELQDKFSSLEDRLGDWPGDSPVGTPTTLTAQSRNRTTPQNGITSPLELQRSYFSWVDNITLQNVINGSLDPVHLIKLVAPEARPKGQSCSAISGINFDLESGKPTLTTDTNIALEKHFPDLKAFTLAMSIYGTIRNVYDPDQLGFSRAILLYIQPCCWYNG
jgi:hypothetical protein